MSKLKKVNDVIIIIAILVVAMLFSLISIIINFRKTYYYNASYKDNYKIDVNANNATIYATKTDTEEFVQGYGPREVSLSYGLNNVDIKVLNNNNVKTYTLQVTRNDNRSNENRLSDLSINCGNINFDSDQNSYNIDVGGNINKVSINASLKSPKSYYIDGYGPRVVSVQEGLNVVFIRVKSESGLENIYKINIFKSNNTTSNINYDNTKLSSLSLNYGTLDFNPDIKEYSMDVDNSIEAIKVYAFAQDLTADVVVTGGESLVDGDNKINIKIVKNNALVNEYVVNVKRKKIENNPDEETKLENLVINGYNINFKEDKYTYELQEGSNDNLIISAYPKSNNSKITIIDNKKSADNNEISIIVTSKSGDTKTYALKVYKKFWTTKNEIIAVLFTFIIGLIILSIIKYYELKKIEEERKKLELKKKAAQKKKNSTTKSKIKNSKGNTKAKSKVTNKTKKK